MIDIDAIKSAANLQEIAGQFTALKGGKALAGPCPKCGGKDRFVVYPDRWLCRNCHPVYGDVIELIKWLNNCDFKAACDWLAGGNIPTLPDVARPPRSGPAMPPKLTPPAERWQQRAADFIAYTARLLWQPDGRRGLDYLRGRGLSDDTIRAARLGYCPRDFFDKPERWGRAADAKKIWLPGPGIVIPWLIDGAAHRVNIRLLEPRDIGGRLVKYIGPAGWGGANPLYNADAITSKKPVLLVEGEFDSLIAKQAAGDFITPVATGSTGGAQAARWIARLATVPAVLVAFDAEPGKGDKAARNWLDLLPNARRWRPLLKDVNEMAAAGVNVRQWVKAALPGDSLVLPAGSCRAVVPGQWQRLPNGDISAVYYGAELQAAQWVMNALE